MKRIAMTGALLLSSLFSFNAMAQMSQEDAMNAVAQRQAVFKLLSFNNAPLGQMARGQRDFDLATAVQSVERIASLAGTIPDVFRAANTSSMMGLETRAANNIWDNQEQFNELAQNLVDGANAALGILNSQGASGLASAVQQIGPNCGACHDVFRTD